MRLEVQAGEKTVVVGSMADRVTLDVAGAEKLASAILRARDVATDNGFPEFVQPRRPGPTCEPTWLRHMPLTGRTRLLVRQLGPGRDPTPHGTTDRYDLLELYFDGAQLDMMASHSQADAIVFDPEKTRRKMATVKWLAQHIYTTVRYDAICIADDDVTPSACTWDDIFDLFLETGADVGQPALAPGSYFSHRVTLRVPGLRWRWTDFVEVMCPIFTPAAFDCVVGLFDVTVSGWSVDDAYMNVLGEGVVLDDAPVLHDRPIGATYAMRDARDEAQMWHKATGTPITSKVTIRHGPRHPGIPPAACWVCLDQPGTTVTGSVLLCDGCRKGIVLDALARAL
jgi:hypothetical protein